ncbi:MAG: WGR domain-containing protein [Gammaproteobacteria bacterium]|nr:WGR domain-containing protein [Gammaproteobacteria bacterium]
MRVYLQTPPLQPGGTRYYHLLIQPDLFAGWNVVRVYGLEGVRGTLLKEHFSSREAAEARLMKFRDAQLRRGYRLMYVEGDSQQRREPLDDHALLELHSA